MPEKKTEDTKDKTFTQDDLDRIVAERVGREKAKYSDYDDLKAKAAKVDEAEESKKGELEKVNEQLGKMQTSLDEERRLRLRAEVAAAKGLTPAQAKRLQGTTQEELEADADDILENLPAPKKGDEEEETEGKSGGSGRTQQQQLPRKPTENLSGGGKPNEEPEETDPAKLAEAIPRN